MTDPDDVDFPPTAYPGREFFTACLTGTALAIVMWWAISELFALV